MHLGLREGAGEAEHTAAPIGANAHGREHGGIPHHATQTHLLVTGIDDQIADLAQRSVAPSRQLVVQQLGGTADLA